jgi:hypothetical protein
MDTDLKTPLVAPSSLLPMPGQKASRATLHDDCRSTNMRGSQEPYCMFLEGWQRFSTAADPAAVEFLLRVAYLPCMLTRFADQQLTHALDHKEHFVHLLSFLSRL